MEKTSLWKWRGIERPIGAAFTIGTAIVAQSYISGHEYLADGIFFYAIALLLGLRFFPKLPFAEQSQELPAARGEGSSLMFDRLGALLAVSAISANLIALSLFGSNMHTNQAWILYGTSVALAPASIWWLSGKPRITQFSGWRFGDAAALGLILAISTALRLYRLDSIPSGLWWDEAYSGLQTLKIVNDPSYRPVYLAGMAQEPALIWYLMAGSFAIFGPSTVALRATAVFGGLLSVLSISLLAKELFGRRAGLVAGFLVATMAWDVNFSRIAFNAIWSVALDTLAVYLLVQGMRKGRLLSFALAGTALGLGLNMYYTSRLIPLILILYLVRRLISEGRVFFLSHLTGLALFSVITIATVSPLLQYAIQKPDDFSSRINQVTIVNEVAIQRSYAPILENLRKHLLMFHYEGDANGRHNLPKAPMLDQVTAALFFLGLVMALRQAHRPEIFLALAWLAIMLFGGVFSLSFEAPQGLRTIDEITAVALLSSLPVVACWEVLTLVRFGNLSISISTESHKSTRVTLSAAGLAILAVCIVVGILNYQRYFLLQAKDYGSWSAFSTAETEIGRQIKAIGVSYEVLLGETFINHPTIEFLTGRKDYPKFDPTVHLPLSGIKNAAIFLEPYQSQALDLLKQYYPQAEVRSLKSPTEGIPVLLSAVIQQQEILKIQGLIGSYYPNTNWAGEPALVERGIGTRFDSKNPRLPPCPYSAVWEGTISAPEFGSYIFKLEGTTTAKLFIDEEQLLAGEQEGARLLAKGLHAVRISEIVHEPHEMALLWKPPSAARLMPVPSEVVFGAPVTNNGLLGSYYGNKQWEGNPVLQRIDPFLNIRVHILPLQRPYSVEWRGKIDIPSSGAYRFATESADTSWVYIDERLAVTNEGANRQMREGSVHLGAGLHDIRVRFCDETSSTFLRVYWTPPGGRRDLLPRERLYPPQGAYRSSTQTIMTAPLVVQPGVPASIAPNMVRVEFLASIRGPSGLFSQPRDVAAGRDGRLYVVDSAAKQVSILSEDGALLGRLQAEFVEPFAVSVAPGGQVLVLDSKGREPIMLFTPDGRLLSRMGSSLGMYSPRGLFVDHAGSIYVADTGRGRVVKLSSTGQLIEEYRGRGQLAQPVSVATSGNGTLFVADADRHQLYIVDASDEVLRSWSIMPSTTFDAPHVALGPRGELYISDPGSGVVRVYDQQGQTLSELGAPGADNAQLNLPTGIQVDARGQLWVTDTGNKRVQRWIIR